MRFIVDVYRYLILATLGLMIVGLVFGVLFLQSTQVDSRYVFLIIGGGIVVIVGTVIATGLVATFISIHDRHAELVEEVRRWREQFYDPSAIQ